MDYLGTSDGSYKPFRIGGSGDISAVAQCVQDLSASECQDCLSEVVRRLKTYCEAAASGTCTWPSVMFGSPKPCPLPRQIIYIIF
ncbi:hypothetical protein NC651_010462 [Populus alba x Populus x berolinensis]|nr:hypothetical protein NC651_010462 [Populus alba x Populus x berolinensis]